MLSGLVRLGAGVAVIATLLALGQGASAQTIDGDGDGFTVAQGDCDDANGAVSPVAPEVSGDRFDSNCDGRDFGFEVGRPASIYRLYVAYFLRDPEPGGWAFWLASDWDLRRMSDFFSRSDEFVERYGSLTDVQFVDLIYRNVLGREAESSGRAFWEEELRSGRRSRGEVMVGFSESVEFADRTTSARPIGQPSSTLLANATPVNRDGCSASSGQPSVSGGLYGSSITCRMDFAETDSVDFQLGRNYDRLTMTIGQSDQSQGEDKIVRFNVYADSVRIFTQDVPYGTGQAVTLDVRNTLTVRLEAIDLTGGTEDVDAVFGSVAAWPTKDSIVYPPSAPFSRAFDSLVAIDERVSSRCSGRSTDQKANGRLFDSTVLCDLDFGETGYAEYVLGRKYRALSATLGIADASGDQKSVEFSIYGDGRLLSQRVLQYGELAPVEIDITGVLRLRIEAVDLTGGTVDVYPVFGTAVVWTDPASVEIATGTSLPVPAELLVSSISPVESAGCTARMGQPALINGASYDHSFGCTIDFNETDHADFVINRQHGSLTMTIGLLDSSDLSKTVRFNVYGDGALIGTWDLGYGQAVPVTLSVDGVLRLRFEVSDLTGGTPDVFPAFGTAVLRP